MKSILKNKNETSRIQIETPLPDEKLLNAAIEAEREKDPDCLSNLTIQIRAAESLKASSKSQDSDSSKARN